MKHVQHSDEALAFNVPAAQCHNKANTVDAVSLAMYY